MGRFVCGVSRNIVNCFRSALDCTRKMKHMANDTNLGSSYNGYYRSSPKLENIELTHVGPGTACGEYLRRFWQPVCLSEQLHDLPLGLRILGEDLVVFRDQIGRASCRERV